MIITEQKPFEEVVESLSGCSRVAVLGCGRCATTCATGGEREVAQMADDLSAKGFKVIYTGVVEAQCDMRLSRKALNQAPEFDAVVAMSCGSGAQALSELTDKPVIPSNNTLYLGVVRRIGDYSQRCIQCGDCTIHETEGVCVKTRCSKGLLNGPCGGVSDGKCEVDGSKECAWTEVIRRLRAKGELKNLGEIRRTK